MNDATFYFLILTFLFFIGSIFGWCLELIFRRFFSDNNPEKKWINPGFLVGPYLPLYGFGLSALFVMSLIPYIGIQSLAEITWIRVMVCILAMGVMMTLIEYIAGVIFIKHMKIKLWDYSSQWGNIQGIICPLFSAFWTILAALYYFFVQPHVINMVRWYFNNIAFTFVVGFFFGVLFVDLGYSLRVVTVIRNYAQEHEIVIKYEELKASIRHTADEAKEKGRFLFAFKSNRPFKDHLDYYRDKIIGYRDIARTEIKDEIREIKDRFLDK